MPRYGSAEHPVSTAIGEAEHASAADCVLPHDTGAGGGLGLAKYAITSASDAPDTGTVLSDAGHPVLPLAGPHNAAPGRAVAYTEDTITLRAIFANDRSHVMR
jgi:hypothetical protein